MFDDKTSESCADGFARWNSTLFTSIPFIQLPVAVVTNDFLQLQDDWDVDRSSHFSNDALQEGQKASILALRSKAASFEYMTNIECMTAYIDPLNATAELILVANETSARNAGSSFVDGWIMGDRPTFWDSASTWICDAHYSPSTVHWCLLDFARTFQDHWTLNITYRDAGSTEPVLVDHCLVGNSADIKSRCGFHYNAVLVIWVIVFTVVDTAIIGYIVIRHADPTLRILGDAIALELDRSERDHETFNDRVDDKIPQEKRKTNARLMKGHWPMHNRPRWFSAVSRKTWIISICL
jgi:hypothetical protein